MNLGTAIQTVFQKYATFDGRARRSEFWYWELFLLIVGVVLGIVDAIIGTAIIGYIWDLVILVPSLAVGCRRLHDTGRTGWWQLIALIPIVGIILLIVWWCGDSHTDNQYGPSPKALAGGYGQGYPPPPQQGYGQQPYGQQPYNG